MGLLRLDDNAPFRDLLCEGVADENGKRCAMFLIPESRKRRSDFMDSGHIRTFAEGLSSRGYVLKRQKEQKWYEKLTYGERRASHAL